MNKKIIISFDYEIFLGENSGTVEKSLLEPTDAILDIFEEEKARGVFFIDTLFLTRCREHLPEKFKKISKQILRMRRLGCEIGMHLHTHWIDAIFQENSWDLSEKRYFRVQDVPRELRGHLIKQSFAVLKEVTGDVHFMPSSFRAGGWCADPFDIIQNEVMKEGIIIDSSIVPKLVNTERNIDYTMFETLEHWALNKRKIEIPITVLRLSGIVLFINKVINLFNKSEVSGDGKGVKQEKGKLVLFSRIFGKTYKMFAIDGMSNFLLEMFLKEGRDRAVLHCVCHPKSVSQRTLKQIKNLARELKPITLLDYYNSLTK